MNRVVLLPALLAFSVVANAGPLVIARDGGSRYTICLSDQASPSEKRGAEELQRFLEEMSGAKLPIVAESAKPKGSLILVGQSGITDRLKLKIAFDQLGPEGFVLKTAKKHIVIAGGRQRGTMYGVYAFLEKLGCRWFSPDVSRIPKMKTITVPALYETGKPAFEYREPFFTEAFNKDWAARNKTNGDHTQLDESTGGKVKYYPFVHSFYEMLPPDKYFGEHPEYYSLIDGKRRVDRGQLCLTNPDVLRLGVEAVRRWIKEHPEATIFSVSQNDWQGWCECDRCRRVEEEEGGVHSGPILRYVNALAEEIEKTNPDKLIDTLAYWYTEKPPLKVRPRPNVRIRLCPIGACEAHPYEKCSRNAYFVKNLRAWSKITNQLYIWHYNTNFAHYLIPFPDFDELMADLPMYRRNGVVGLFLQGAYATGGGGENAELRSYVMAKLLWNPSVDTNRLIDEFHETYYGRAAKTMREYFNLLHNEVRMPPSGKGTHIWIFVVPEYSEEFLPAAKKLFAKAESEAENEAVLARVRKARLSIDYLELLKAMRFEVRNGSYAPVGLDGLKERFDGFLSAVRGYGIQRLHEWWGLDWDEKYFAESMKPFRVVTLENERLRVDVAPDLTGRVIRMIDKKTGRDAVRRIDLGERTAPDVGGLAAFAYPDFVSRPFEAKWRLEGEPSASEVKLLGRCLNGLRMTRVIRLAGATVETETTLENPSTSPIEAVLQSRFEADASPIDDASAAWRRKDGTPGGRKIIDPEEEPSGSENYAEGAVPDGEWSLLSGSAARLVNRFPSADAERTQLSWTGKGAHKVTLTVWSKKKTLATGESIRLASSYEPK
ncbi:MAG: DUF4838 domain-containing protein [Bryobacteraceae bacterium]